MTTSVLVPDGLLASDNLSGTLSTINVDDTSWLTALGDNSNSVVIVSFPTPSNNPTTGAGVQNFTVKYRVTSNGTPIDFDAYLLGDGVRLNGGSPISSWVSGSVTEVTKEIPWDASLLSAPSGVDVELEIVATKSGGPSSQRTTGEFQFIDWDVTYAGEEITGAASTNVASNTVSNGQKNSQDTTLYNQPSTVSLNGSKSSIDFTSMVTSTNSLSSGSRNSSGLTSTVVNTDESSIVQKNSFGVTSDTKLTATSSNSHKNSEGLLNESMVMSDSVVGDAVTTDMSGVATTIHSSTLTSDGNRSTRAVVVDSLSLSDNISVSKGSEGLVTETFNTDDIVVSAKQSSNDVTVFSNTYDSVEGFKGMYSDIISGMIHSLMMDGLRNSPSSIYNSLMINPVISEGFKDVTRDLSSDLNLDNVTQGVKQTSNVTHTSLMYNLMIESCKNSYAFFNDSLITLDQLTGLKFIPYVFHPTSTRHNIKIDDDIVNNVIDDSVTLNIV